MRGEEYRVRISNGVYVGPGIFLLASIGLTQIGVESGAGPIFGVLGVLIGTPGYVWSCLRYKLSHGYLVAGKHLRISTGMFGSFSKGEADVPLASISSIAVNRSLLGQIFGYGHVSIELNSGRRIYLKWLAAPDEFIRRLRP